MQGSALLLLTIHASRVAVNRGQFYGAHSDLRLSHTSYARSHFSTYLSFPNCNEFLYILPALFIA